MKLNKILSVLITLSVIAVATVFTFTNPTSGKDGLLMENVAALANGWDNPNNPIDPEEDGGRAVCYSSCIGQLAGHSYLQCGTCVWADGIAGDRGGYCKW